MHVKADGEKVRALRLANGTNADEFARRAGISATTLRRAERDRVVKLWTARKIGDALGMHPREFARVV